MDFSFEKIGDRVKASVSLTTDEIMEFVGSAIDSNAERASDTNYDIDTEKLKENLVNEIKQYAAQVKSK